MYSIRFTVTLFDRSKLLVAAGCRDGKGDLFFFFSLRRHAKKREKQKKSVCACSETLTKTHTKKGGEIAASCTILQV